MDLLMTCPTCGHIRSKFERICSHCEPQRAQVAAAAARQRGEILYGLVPTWRWSLRKLCDSVRRRNPEPETPMTGNWLGELSKVAQGPDEPVRPVVPERQFPLVVSDPIDRETG
jgi:hypothetical protein